MKTFCLGGGWPEVDRQLAEESSRGVTFAYEERDLPHMVICDIALPEVVVVFFDVTLYVQGPGYSNSGG